MFWRSIAFACLSSGALLHAQNIVVNGSFEDGFFLGGPYRTLDENSTVLTAWRVAPGGQLRWFDIYGWSAADGYRSVELNEQAPASLYQSVPTVAGSAYRLTFSMAGDPYGLNTIRTMRVHVGPVTADYTFDVLGHFNVNMGWREESLDFVASSNITLLLFESTTPGFAGPAVDYVSIVPTVPVCVADVDDGSGTGTRDGGVTIDDLLYYLQIFEQGTTAADVDDGTGTGTPDGGVTIDDLLFFLFRFEQGC